MRTYAKAWVHPTRKLSSCTDKEGNNNPTWNDKFVFRVEEEFLREDSSAVMIEIYFAALVTRCSCWHGSCARRQPCSPACLDPSEQLALHGHALRCTAAINQRLPCDHVHLNLIGFSTSKLDNRIHGSGTSSVRASTGNTKHRTNNNNKHQQQAPALKPILRRSRSERSERLIFDDFSPRSSMVGVPTQMGTKEGSSILTVAESVDPFKGGKKKGKASSVINRVELREKPKQKGKKGKARKPVIGAPFKGNSIVSDSEVGPSPSEVAAALAQRRYLQDDNQSSVLDGWSLDESVEGLRSKLERWRTELPPLYDNGFSTSSYKSSGGQHGRRHSDGGSGLFSCFGNICGYECQCILREERWETGKAKGRRRRLERLTEREARRTQVDQESRKESRRTSATGRMPGEQKGEVRGRAEKKRNAGTTAKGNKTAQKGEGGEFEPGGK
ncbi:UNVERIFIED_CONTAM: hypothetical protein Scaly_1069900 [Sesamum calycinum]|uniref:C2 domain-containing protein n=1 Tax=Sesamum calycinum TaxID=2727403 RepID=A0AAW2QKQ8_9LAMI